MNKMNAIRFVSADDAYVSVYSVFLRLPAASPYSQTQHHHLFYPLSTFIMYLSTPFHHLMSAYNLMYWMLLLGGPIPGPASDWGQPMRGGGCRASQADGGAPGSILHKRMLIIRQIMMRAPGISMHTQHTHTRKII